MESVIALHAARLRPHEKADAFDHFDDVVAQARREEAAWQNK